MRIGAVTFGVVYEAVLIFSDDIRGFQTRGHDPTCGRLIYKWGLERVKRDLLCFIHLFTE